MKIRSKVFKVEGHPEKELLFDPVSRCGNIEDGVGFTNGQSGGWVLAYEDLLEMVELASRARRLTRAGADLAIVASGEGDLKEPQGGSA